MRLLYLPDLLRDAGFEIHVEPGWETRGRTTWGPVKAIICHHTAWPMNTQDYPSLALVRDGRADVPGPLSQLGLGRSGKVYVIASGRANHAGQGYHPEFSGSSESIGIEAEHPGGSWAWTATQYDAYVELVSVLANHEDVPTRLVLGHKEWATPPGRKVDPNFNMDTFRSRVNERRDSMAILTDEEQLELRNFLAFLKEIRSNVGFVKFVIPWFRELSGLTPEALAELEESDEVEALEAKIASMVAGTVPPHRHTIASSTSLPKS